MSLALLASPPTPAPSYLLDPRYLAASQRLAERESLRFLAFYGFGDERSDAEIVPVIRRELGAGSFDLRTPTGFPGPAAPDRLLARWDEIAEGLGEIGCVSVYLQCRGEAAPGGASAGDAVDASRFRTVYLLDLAGDLDAIRAACRRDTRQRVNKLLRDRYALSAAPSADFARCYVAIAERNGFSPLYRLDEQRFAAIAAAEHVRYVEVRDEDDAGFIGGGFIGGRGRTADYLYSAYDEARPNAGRVTLWHVIAAAKRAGFGALNLGGGIAEDDALAGFKASFGAVPARWSALRAVTDLKAAAALAGGAPEAGWFAGWFPPYAKAA